MVRYAVLCLCGLVAAGTDLAAAESWEDVHTLDRDRRDLNTPSNNDFLRRMWHESESLPGLEIFIIFMNDGPYLLCLCLFEC